jgi:hypothetical protein
LFWYLLRQEICVPGNWKVIACFFNLKIHKTKTHSSAKKVTIKSFMLFLVCLALPALPIG